MILNPMLQWLLKSRGCMVHLACRSASFKKYGSAKIFSVQLNSKRFLENPCALFILDVGIPKRGLVFEMLNWLEGLAEKPKE